MTGLSDCASKGNWGDDHENALSWCRVRNSCGFRLTSVRPSVQMERSLLRLPGLSGIRLGPTRFPYPLQRYKKFMRVKIPLPQVTARSTQACPFVPKHVHCTAALST